MKKITDNEFRNVMCIYKITNKANGKVYIGSTTNLKKRINDHIHKLNNNTHHNPMLQNSWNASHEDNFYVEIVELVEDESFLPFAEMYHIEKYRRKSGVYNFNNPLEEYSVISSRRKKVTPTETKKKPDIKKESAKEIKNNIKHTIISEFDYMFVKLKEQIGNEKCMEFSKISEFIIKNISLLDCDDKNIENNIIRVLKSYSLTVYNFESLMYIREILNKYGVYTYKRSILSKELAKKISDDLRIYSQASN